MKPSNPIAKQYRDLQKADSSGARAEAFKNEWMLNHMAIGAPEQSAPAQGAPTSAPVRGAPAAQGVAPTAVPPLNTWMSAAKKANPGVSDAELAAYYNQKYGK